MTIEVRQLLIKSTVLPRDGAEKRCGGGCLDLERIKAELLAECRQILLEISSEAKER